MLSVAPSSAEVRPAGAARAASLRARALCEEFAEDYGTVRSDRGYAREGRRRRKAIKREAETAAGITYETLRRDLMAAFDAISAGTATQEQRDMVNRSEDAKFFAARYGSDQKRSR